MSAVALFLVLRVADGDKAAAVDVAVVFAPVVAARVASKTRADCLEPFWSVASSNRTDESFALRCRPRSDSGRVAAAAAAAVSSRRRCSSSSSSFSSSSSSSSSASSASRRACSRRCFSQLRRNFSDASPPKHQWTGMSSCLPTSFNSF